jgi:glycosyltransferase involved in cell wall biosynthesis
MSDAKLKQKIAICLATYNGKEFIGEFVDTLSQQSEKDFILVVRDDGSSDGTLSALRSLTAVRKLKIEIIEDQKGNIGPASNFMTIIDSIDADYYFLADQDDKWYSNKIETILKEFNRFDAGVPTAIFSDFDLIDEKSRFLRAVKLNESLVNIKYSNHIPGCTLAFNKALKKTIPLKSSNIFMHDWWILLTLFKEKGRISKTREPLIAYRQHGNNAVGWRKKETTILEKLENIIKTRKSIYQNLKETKMIGGSYISYLIGFIFYKVFNRK